MGIVFGLGGVLKPKSDIANVSAQAVTFSHDFRVLLGRIVSSGVENSFVDVQGEQQVRDVELRRPSCLTAAFVISGEHHC